MAQTILVSGYFGGPGHDRKLRFFESLETALRAENWRPILFDLSPDPVETQLEVIQASYAATLAKYLPGTLAPAPGSRSAVLREAAEVESLNWGCGTDRGALRVSQFAYDLIQALAVTDAKLCVLWHQFGGFHRYAAELCASVGVPVVFAEYGELPGTVALSTTGQMGLSAPARDPELFAALPVDEAQLDAVRTYVQAAAAARATRKPQPAPEATRQTLETLRATGKPIVFYAGQNDPQAGLVPRSLPDASTHSPHYEDTFDALVDLDALAKTNGWSLVFKPHPMLAAQHAARARALCPSATIVEEGDIFACIDAADVTVTLVSQVAYLALIRNKPAAVLGHIALSGSGCAFETTSRDGVEETLLSALAVGFNDSRRVARDRHFAQLLQEQLIPVPGEDLRPPGRSMGDAATLLIEAAGTPAKPGRAHELGPGDLPTPVRNAAVRSAAALAAPLRKIFR